MCLSSVCVYVPQVRAPVGSVTQTPASLCRTAWVVTPTPQMTGSHWRRSGLSPLSPVVLIRPTVLPSAANTHLLSFSLIHTSPSQFVSRLMFVSGWSPCFSSHCPCLSFCFVSSQTETSCNRYCILATIFSRLSVHVVLSWKHRKRLIGSKH